ncbi:MAG: class I SAM-dependent methyltransferase [Myxococcales bacterium]|nr:class I SAM-dependent methyltransferase [Myxococcales bacterium]
MQAEDRIRWIYQSRDQAELSRRYDAWAEDYDQHLEGALDYVAPALGVAMFAEHVPLDARVLDVGAGTGLVGERLHAAGYRDITGVDYSPGMLAQARKKQVYSRLAVQDLLEPLDLESASFDALISIGVFSFGHVTAEAFAELIRVTRPGGIILFSVLRAFYEHGSFRADLEALEKAGRWTLRMAGQPFASRRDVDSDAAGLAFIYEVN